MTHEYKQLIAPVEFWKPITTKEVPHVKPYYWVSSLGRVYSTKSNKFLKTFQDKKSEYISVGLRTEYGSVRVLLHRLVMMTFYPIQGMEKYEVNHMYTGDKDINTTYNLEWCTRPYNIAHAWENGLYHVGEDHHNAKLTNDEVHVICQGLVQNLPYEVIANNIGRVLDPVLSSTISDIKAGRRWAHISSLYTFPTGVSYQLLTDNQVHEVCKLLEQNLKMNQIEILERVGVNTSSLDNVNLKKYIHCVDRIRRRDRFVSISKNYNF